MAVDALLSSHAVRLSAIFGDAVLTAAARRARTVKAKATENYEERGLPTLFLAWGMATWSNARGTATPAAPLLLRQAALNARSGAGEDFDLSLPGEGTSTRPCCTCSRPSTALSLTGTRWWSIAQSRTAAC